MQDVVFLFAFAYILSLGMGMVFWQSRGITKVNRFWWGLFIGTLRLIRRTIGHLFRRRGKQAKKH